MSRDDTITRPRGPAHDSPLTARAALGAGPSKIQAATWTAWPSSTSASRPPSRSSTTGNRPPGNTPCADRAVALGWPADRVLVIDDDQGRSGRSRRGPARLPAAPGRGRPGPRRVDPRPGDEPAGPLLQGLASAAGVLRRVPRPSWPTRTALYDPTDHNDRLLLGPARDHERGRAVTSCAAGCDRGKLNKARRGELFLHVPDRATSGSPSGECRPRPRRAGPATSCG